MEFLKRALFSFALLLISSCGDESRTVTIKLRTDTFISSDSEVNNSDLDYLKISRTSGAEDRILIKLPGVDDSEDDFFENCWEDYAFCGVFLLPLSIVSQILTTCENNIIQASNLTSAVLVFNTSDGSSITAGDVGISLLAKPWWQSSTWNMAHPFSGEGQWLSPGGDLDNSVSFENNCTNLSSGSCDSGEIKFEMTSYFQSLLNQQNNQHYGMVIYPNVDLAESKIYSVQANSTLSPRIVATYTGSCVSSVSPKYQETKTFYLGSEF